MSVPKRHHYLPEFYLAGFTTEGGRTSNFTVFDRDESVFRQQTPKNTATSRYYYAVEDETTGAKSMEIEEFLSSVESEAAPVIRKLERHGAPTDHDREVLALFCALLHTRVPQFDRSMQELINGAFRALAHRDATNVEDVRIQHEEFEARTGTPMGMSPEEDFELLKDDRYTIVEPRRNVIKMMLQLSGDLAEVFLNMRWAIAYTPPRKSLIVTDVPLLLIPPAERRSPQRSFGIATPGVHKMIPLTRTMALFIGDVGPGFDFLGLTQAEVRENNLALASRCERFVIGCDEALVRSVIRRAQLEGSMRPPLVTVE